MLILNGDILFLISIILKILVIMSRMFYNWLRIHCLNRTCHLIDIILSLNRGRFSMLYMFTRCVLETLWREYIHDICHRNSNLRLVSEMCGSKWITISDTTRSFGLAMTASSKVLAKVNWWCNTIIAGLGFFILVSSIT